MKESLKSEINSPYSFSSKMKLNLSSHLNGEDFSFSLHNFKENEKTSIFFTSEYFIIKIFDILFKIIYEKLLHSKNQNFENEECYKNFKQLKLKIKRILKEIKAKYSTVILVFIYLDLLIASYPTIILKTSIEK